MQSGPVSVAAALLVTGGALAGRLPFRYLAGRTALVLPFALAAAAVVAWTEGVRFATALVLRAVLSAAAVVVVAGTTDTVEIARALQKLGLPALVADTVLLTIRYLQSITAEAASIRRAMLSRGGHWSWSASGSGIGVLFASSLRRSEAVHRAMLARGYSGEALTVGDRFAHSRRADLVLFSSVAVALTSAWAWLLWNR